MPLPGDLNKISVTATYADGSGNPLAGYVTFTPAADLTDSTGRVILRAEPIPAQVVGGVMTPPSLVCTDNVNISPSGWTWNVTEYISGAGANAATRSYSVLLPHTLGSTVDLSTLSPTVPQAGVTSYLLASNNLSDLTNASAARTNLGLGSAATQASSAFAQTANNLADLASASTARTNLGLGGAATENVGTGAGTVAAGNDTRITGALQSSNNLSDLGSASTARTNLGLGNSATENVGTGAGTVAAGNDSRITGALQSGNNLSDVASAATSRTNLGLGTAATLASSAVAQTANNLSDLASAATARTNLGLGGAATENVGTTSGTVAAGNDPRITGALQGSNNLSDVQSAAAARTNLGLTGAATASLPISVANGGTNSTSAAAAQVQLGGVSWFNVQAPAYGAVGNGNLVADAVMTASSATLTSATASFTSADVGKLIQVRGAGTSGADLNTTISAFTNSTTVTLTVAAGTTVSAAQCVYGTDDATAVQAAITAAEATNYGTVYLPPGIYLWSTAVSINKCMRLTGQNALIVTTNSGAINLTNTYLSPTPGIFGRTAGLEIDHLQIDCTGGHCIYNVNLSNFTWHDLVLTQRSSNFSAVWHDTTGTNFIGGLINNVKTFAYGSTRTIQAWRLVSHVGGGLALTKWTECLWQNQGTDTSQFLLWTEARGGTNYTNGLELDSCVFTSATGGGAAFWSAQGVVLNNCRVVNSNNTTNGNSIYRVGTNTGSGVSTYTSQGITILGCGRDLPGPDGSSTFDVHLDSTVDLVAIIGFECRWRSTDTAKTPFFNLNSATHVVVLDCPTAVITNPGNAIQIPLSGDGNTAAAGDGAASFGSISLGTALPIASGGTGAATQQAALNAIAGATTAAQFLRGNGTNVTMSAIQAADVPTLNQSTTGTAAGLSSTLAIGSGGTGQTSAAAAYNALSPMTTTGDLEFEASAGSAARLPGNTTATKNFLTQTGTGSASQAPAWGTIAAADVPTLNQNTTGTAANVTGTVAVGNGGTGQTSAVAAYNALSPMTTLGDIEYESGANTASRLAGNTSSTNKFLTQAGTGTVSAAPGWNTIQSSDIPSNGNVQTFLNGGGTTWTKPASATMVTVICIGAGGGGGSGAVENSGTVASGGAGGGGGGYSIKTIPASLLSSTETVAVGGGGTGGTAVGTTASAGNAGGAGGATSFKSTSWIVANGGAGGGAGGTGAASGGTGGVGSINGGTGASSSSSGAAGGTGSTSSQGASGGGAGGGMATTPASVAGGAGGLVQSSSGNVGGTAGTSGGGAGGAGTSGAANAPVAGTGGGGGGSLTAGTGGTGGAGGTYGGGGGGGAGATTGQSSGAGGNGANGICVVISIN